MRAIRQMIIALVAYLLFGLCLGIAVAAQETETLLEAAECLLVFTVLGGAIVMTMGVAWVVALKYRINK